MKKYKQARDDCQTAVTLQSATASGPQAKVYARLARCHLALGDPSAAIHAANKALELDSTNAPVMQTRGQAEQMQAHLDRCQESRERKDWGMAKWALDRAMQTCEGDVPIVWRVWKVEFEIAKKQWDEAIGTAT